LAFFRVFDFVDSLLKRPKFCCLKAAMLAPIADGALPIFGRNINQSYEGSGINKSLMHHCSFRRFYENEHQYISKAVAIALLVFLLSDRQPGRPYLNTGSEQKVPSGQSLLLLQGRKRTEPRWAPCANLCARSSNVPLALGVGNHPYMSCKWISCQIHHPHARVD
jgi:hypothetical protein